MPSRDKLRNTAHTSRNGSAPVPSIRGARNRVGAAGRLSSRIKEAVSTMIFSRLTIQFSDKGR